MPDYQPSPALRVLHLPELLELILSHLTARDLLLSQRVSHVFQAVIAASPRLQRALFLRPDPEPVPTKTRSTRPENNRLLARAFPTNYPTVTLCLGGDGDRRRASEAVDGIAADDDSGGRPAQRRATQHWSVGIAFPARATPAVRAPAAVWRADASWRRMYLSQPPCRALHLARRWRWRSPCAVVECDAGVTMGQLVDAALRRVEGGEGGADGRDEDGAPGHVSGGWPAWYVGSDDDWHFEGRLAVEG